MKPKPRRKVPRGIGDALRVVVRQRAAPEQIALGFSIGAFIAFSPTVGIQIPLVLLVATLFKANRISALIPIWITNVFTIPPVYGFTYRIGHVFLPGREPRKVRQILETLRDRIAEFGFYDLRGQFRAFARLSADLVYPMLIGGLIVGLLAALITYPITLRIVQRHRRRRSARIRARGEERRRATGSAQAPPLQSSPDHR